MGRWCLGKQTFFCGLIPYHAYRGQCKTGRKSDIAGETWKGNRVANKSKAETQPDHEIGGFGKTFLLF